MAAPFPAVDSDVGYASGPGASDTDPSSSGAVCVDWTRPQTARDWPALDSGLDLGLASTLAHLRDPSPVAREDGAKQSQLMNQTRQTGLADEAQLFKSASTWVLAAASGPVLLCPCVCQSANQHEERSASAA